jgi:hypothetical protein
MSRVPDKDVKHAETTTGEPVGKVVIDSRGHNVWQWARDVLESTSVLLKRLENKELALEPTPKVPVVRDEDPTKGQKTGKPGAKAAKHGDKEADAAPRHPALQRERDRQRDGGGGFEPYNSR